MDENSGLDPDIAEILDRAAPYPDAPVELRSRVREAVMTRIAAGALHSVAEHGTNPDAPRSLPPPATATDSSSFAEEREALAINVLVTLGRYEEARERSARFLQRYPESLLRGSVEAAVAAIP